MTGDLFLTTFFQLFGDGGAEKQAFEAHFFFHTLTPKKLTKCYQKDDSTAHPSVQHQYKLLELENHQKVVKRR